MLVSFGVKPGEDYLDGGVELLNQQLLLGLDSEFLDNLDFWQILWAQHLGLVHFRVQHFELIKLLQLPLN